MGLPDTGLVPFPREAAVHKRTEQVGECCPDEPIWATIILSLKTPKIFRKWVRKEMAWSQFHLLHNHREWRRKPQQKFRRDTVTNRKGLAPSVTILPSKTNLKSKVGRWQKVYETVYLTIPQMSTMIASQVFFSQWRWHLVKLFSAQLLHYWATVFYFWTRLQQGHGSIFHLWLHQS